MPPRPIVMSAEAAKLYNRHARWSRRKRETYRWLVNQLNIDIHELERVGQIEGPCVFQSMVADARIVAWIWTTDDTIAVCVTSVRFGDGDGWRPAGGPRKPCFENLDVISGSRLRGSGRYWELDQDYGDDIGAPGPVNRESVGAALATAPAAAADNEPDAGVDARFRYRAFLSFRHSDLKSAMHFRDAVSLALQEASLTVFICGAEPTSAWCEMELEIRNVLLRAKSKFEAVKIDFTWLDDAIRTYGNAALLLSATALRPPVGVPAAQSVRITLPRQIASDPGDIDLEQHYREVTKSLYAARRLPEETGIASDNARRIYSNPACDFAASIRGNVVKQGVPAATA